MNKIKCPLCGFLKPDEINIYDIKLKKQNISILPINPHSIKCGANVTISHKCTCGSGKTTVAEELVKLTTTMQLMATALYNQ